MNQKVQDSEANDAQDFEKRKNKQHWKGLASSILQVLKKSVDKTALYSQKLINNQEFFIRKMGKEYLQALKKKQQVTFSINISKVFWQFKQKLLGISQLTFPKKKIELKPQLSLRSRTLSKFMNLLLKAYYDAGEQATGQEIIITPSVLRNVIQQNSKLNYEQDLFILKAFMVGSDSNSKYFTSEIIKIPTIKGENQYLTKEVAIYAVHSYCAEEGIDIVSSNIPSLSNVKKVYSKSMGSEQVAYAKNNDVQFNVKRMLGDCSDNNRSSQNCFKYFGQAMELEFFNSLLEPISLQRFLNYFSITENVSICRALILGGLTSLLEEDYTQQCQDSEEEYQWESAVQKISKQFCGQIFSGYFQGQEETREVARIARNIWKINRQNHKSVYGIVQEHWLS